METPLRSPVRRIQPSPDANAERVRTAVLEGPVKNAAAATTSPTTSRARRPPDAGDPDTGGGSGTRGGDRHLLGVSPAATPRPRARVGRTGTAQFRHAASRNASGCTHDFPDEQLGKAIPYGVYDLAANAGWVSVGTDHDTAAFAVESIRRWWNAAGRAAYPGARRLLITADAGGSNGYRTRAWKAELAAFALQAGLAVTVCHFPPGTGPGPRNGTGSSTGCSPTSP